MQEKRTIKAIWRERAKAEAELIQAQFNTCAPLLHVSSGFLLMLDVQTVESYSIWLTAAR